MAVEGKEPSDEVEVEEEEEPGMAFERRSDEVKSYKVLEEVPDTVLALGRASEAIEVQETCKAHSDSS